jgi:hypothetical protein
VGVCGAQGQAWGELVTVRDVIDPWAEVHDDDHEEMQVRGQP